MERPPLGPASRYLPPRVEGLATVPATHVGLGEPRIKESFPIASFGSSPAQGGVQPPAQHVMASVVPPGVGTLVPSQPLQHQPGVTVGSGVTAGTSGFTQGTIGKVVVPALGPSDPKDKKKKQMKGKL